MELTGCVQDHIQLHQEVGRQDCGGHEQGQAATSRESKKRIVIERIVIGLFKLVISNTRKDVMEIGEGGAAE